MKKFEDIISNRAERTISQVFEQSGTSVNRGEMIPAYFYSLSIEIPNINESWIPRSTQEYRENPEGYITEKQYFDLNPCGLMLHHERWREFSILVNLKPIPPIYRAKLLAVYYTLARPLIEKLYYSERVDGNEVEKLLPFKERGTRHLPFYGISQDMLQAASGLNLNYSINKYNLEAVRNARILDWDKFGELPFAAIDSRAMMTAPNIGSIADIFDRFEQKQQS